MRIGVFISTREQIIAFAQLIKKLPTKGYRVLIYDISEERGWFEKGVQYASLDYPRPNGLIDLNLNDTSSIEKAVERVKLYIERHELDITLTYGYSIGNLIVAIASRSMNTPNIHINSGLRTYLNILDEYIRQFIDHTAHYHYTLLPQHNGNLINERIDPRYLKISGSLIIDSVLQNISNAVKMSTILEELDLNTNSYTTVFINDSSILSDVLDQLIKYSESYSEYLIMPLPRLLKKSLIENDIYYNTMEKHDILFLEILDYLDHLNLIYNSKAVITSDEWIAIEALVLRKPTVLITRGKPIMLNWSDVRYIDISKVKNLADEISRLLRNAKIPSNFLNTYGGGTASEVISDSIENFLRLNLKDHGINSLMNGKMYVRFNSSLSLEKISFKLPDYITIFKQYL